MCYIALKHKGEYNGYRQCISNIILFLQKHFDAKLILIEYLNVRIYELIRTITLNILIA